MPYKAYASTTGNTQVTTGGVTITGFTVVAAAAATVTLRDGTGATDPIIGQVVLAGAGATTLMLPPTRVGQVFIERSAAAAVTVFFE